MSVIYACHCASLSRRGYQPATTVVAQTLTDKRNCQFATTLNARLDGHLISQMDQQSGQSTPKYIFLIVSLVEPSTVSKTMNECPLQQMKDRCITGLPLPMATIPLNVNHGP